MLHSTITVVEHDGINPSNPIQLDFTSINYEEQTITLLHSSNAANPQKT